MKSLLLFFLMHGYGLYIFSAYTIVFLILSLQLFIPWQRWRSYKKQLPHQDRQKPSRPSPSFTLEHDTTP